MSIVINESRGYKVFIFVISGFIAGFSIANIIYFNRLRTTPSSALSSTEATALLWLNIILLILAAIAFIWSIIELVTTHKIIIPNLATSSKVSTESVNLG